MTITKPFTMKIEILKYTFHSAMKVIEAGMLQEKEGKQYKSQKIVGKPKRYGKKVEKTVEVQMIALADERS